MSDWYYAEASKQRQGPLPAENLRELFQSGRIGLDTLVWREGLTQWQPLGDFAGELGLLDLVSGPLPPPLPQVQNYSARPISAAPKSGLSGCMIALIVVVVLAIPMLGILAAIALPAYQDYTLRAKVSAALPVAGPLKLAMVEHLTQHQACPDNDDTGFGPPDSYASGVVAAAAIGTFESDQCGIELMLTVPGNDQLDGKAVWFEYNPSNASWQCSSEIDDKYLPVNCRG